MITNRAMHCACELNGFIYVVGGTTTNDENTSISKVYFLLNKKIFRLKD